jgi:hypothetical protein
VSHPYSWLPRPVRPTALLVLCGLMVVVLLTRQIGFGIPGAAAGRDPAVSGMFVGLVDDTGIAARVLAAWGPQGLAVVGWWLGLDVVFLLLAYAAILPLACGMLADRITRPAGHQVGCAAAWAAVGAAAADWIETAATAQLLLFAGPGWLLDLVRAAAVLKFSLVASALTFLAAGGVVILTRRIHRRMPSPGPSTPP